MSLNDAAEKVNNWAVLTALARLGMFLTPLLLTVFLFVASQWINAYNVRMDGAEHRIAAVEQTEAGTVTRVGQLETRISVVGPQRDQFQRDTQATLKELSATLTQILQAEARIIAELDDMKEAHP